jgi:hypothetical protein
VGAHQVDISHDNKNAYVASEGDGVNGNSAVAVFSLNRTTGARTQLSGTAGCIADTGGDPTCAAGVGLNQAVFVRGTADGSNIYTAAQAGNAITVFSRNATTGALTQLSGTNGCVSSDGTAGSCAIGTALDLELSLNASSNGKNVYATVYIAGSLLAFSRTVSFVMASGAMGSPVLVDSDYTSSMLSTSAPETGTPLLWAMSNVPGTNPINPTWSWPIGANVIAVNASFKSDIYYLHWF